MILIFPTTLFVTSSQFIVQDLLRNEKVNYTNWKGGDGNNGDNCAFMFTDEVKYARSVFSLLRAARSSTKDF